MATVLPQRVPCLLNVARDTISRKLATRACRAPLEISAPSTATVWLLTLSMHAQLATTPTLLKLLRVHFALPASNAQMWQPVQSLAPLASTH